MLSNTEIETALFLTILQQTIIFDFSSNSLITLS